ncbi:DUF6380 family protein [Streptomyces sp. NBC_01433]
MDRTGPGRRATLRWPVASLTATIRMATLRPTTPDAATISLEGDA